MSFRFVEVDQFDFYQINDIEPKYTRVLNQQTQTLTKMDEVIVDLGLRS